MEDWQKYEELVAKIYTELEPHATVTLDDKIRGKDSGSLRQIDVTIRYNVAGHDLLMIVQAKDHKRKADVNVVGEFVQVIKDVGASKGILICNAGFTKGAQTYAKNLGVDLCSVFDANSKKWQAELKIPILLIGAKLKFEVDFAFDVKETFPEKDLESDDKKWIFSLDKKMAILHPNEIFIDLWNTHKLNYEEGKHKIQMLDSKFYYKRKSNNWLNVIHYNIDYEVHTEKWFKYCNLEEYRGIQKLGENVKFSHIKVDPEEFKEMEDKGWTRINSKEEVAVQTKEYYLTYAVAQKKIDHFKIADQTFEKIEDPRKK